MKTSKTDDSSANGGSVVGLPVDSSLKGSSDEDEEEAGTDSLTCTTKNNGDYCTKKSTPHQSLEERVQELETKLATLSRLLQRRTVVRFNWQSFFMFLLLLLLLVVVVVVEEYALIFRNLT